MNPQDDAEQQDTIPQESEAEMTPEDMRDLYDVRREEDF